MPPSAPPSAPPWRAILEPPKFNTYFFVVCSVAHTVRLLTGSTSPYLSALLFVFEYGLLSSFIEVEHANEGSSWSDLIERHRSDIVAVATWCANGVTTSATTQEFSGIAGVETPVPPALSAQYSGESQRGVLDSCSDSDSDSDSDSCDDISTLTSLLKKK